MSRRDLRKYSARSGGGTTTPRPATPARTRRPASLEVVALLQKTSVQQVALDIRYEGFTIPPEFVVGYGLDYDERFRNLPYIALLKPEAYAGVPG